MALDTPTAAQLLGMTQDHLVSGPDGCRLQPAVVAALAQLQADAAAAGFHLAVASGFRDFDRQRQIWNAKASGQRPVHDDAGRRIDLDALTPGDQIHAILRFSALPGASRHHWGCDLDVFDAAACPADYRVQLSPAEVADDGLFGPFHRWLDQRIASGHSHGFFRPYGVDRGGVAPERWHLSYAPVARVWQTAWWQQAWIDNAWREALTGAALALKDSVLAELAMLRARYVEVPWSAYPEQVS